MNAPLLRTTLPLDPVGLDLLFREGRTFNAFLDAPVAEETILEAVRLAHLGPTGVNSVPARFLIVSSASARATLVAAMSEGNRAKTASAPATVVVASDPGFTETLSRTFPHAPGAKDWFAGEAAIAYADYNTALQAGYFILALRALGLDAGPMGGFDKAAVDSTLLAGTGWRSSLVVNVGIGDRSSLRPRGPRLDLAEISRVV